MYLTNFTVEGAGRFPLDMLRYDSCFPLRQEDVSRIDDRNRERVTVKLAMYHATSKPNITDARWSSFGWSVVRTGFDAPTSRKV